MKISNVVKQFKIYGDLSFCVLAGFKYTLFRIYEDNTKLYDAKLKEGIFADRQIGGLMMKEAFNSKLNKAIKLGFKRLF